MKKAKGFLINFADMCHRHQVQIEKLCWRIISDGGVYPEETYDLAVAYLEGASTYFVADHVKARKKAAFIHIDYGSAGYTRKLDQGCYDAFDRIFAVSDEVKEKFLGMYPEYKSRMYIFHNIIDQNRIRKRAAHGTGFTDDFDGYRILTVGRLTYQKAYDIAIQALYRVKKSGVKVRWYVLGEGEKRSELEKQILALGLEADFLLPGAVNNPYPYYKQCDLYVHATRYEGKSIAIQEAQTLGCAILASDCSGNREQIIDGVDGRFCKLTPEGVAASITELLADKALRSRLGKAAAEKKLYNEEELQQLTDML